MCLILLAWQSHPRYRLVLAANRDEWHARPTQPAGWWPDAPGLYGGRDLQGGGTWLGITRPGRFAALTNHRNLHRPTPPGASRGQLVTGFLNGTDGAAAYLDQVAGQRDRWPPFNLLAAAADGLFVYGSAGNAPPVPVAPGVHGLSNHLFDTPWPKVTQGRARLACTLAQPLTTDALQQALLALLADSNVAADDQLPDTGLTPERERALSATLIVDPDYGTRCSTVLLWQHDGQWSLLERRFDRHGAVTGTGVGSNR